MPKKKTMNSPVSVPVRAPTPGFGLLEDLGTVCRSRGADALVIIRLGAEVHMGLVGGPALFDPELQVIIHRAVDDAFAMTAARCGIRKGGIA